MGDYLLEAVLAGVCGGGRSGRGGRGREADEATAGGGGDPACAEGSGARSRCGSSASRHWPRREDGEAGGGRGGHERRRSARRLRAARFVLPRRALTLSTSEHIEKKIEK
jgi:hypothetical protein